MVPGIRAQQKEQTRQRIAYEAGRLFGERGFDRASVRDIASAAAVDPALVLHYFGSKRALFQHVMGAPANAAEVGDPVDFILAGLIAKLDDQASAALAQLRSMLTNEDARAHARTQLDGLATALAAVLPGDQPNARAQLLLATTLGVAIAREVLQVDALADRTPTEVAELLRPGVVALVGG